MKDDKNALLDAIEGDRVVTVSTTRALARSALDGHRNRNTAIPLAERLWDAVERAAATADTPDHDAFVMIRIKGSPIAVE